MQEVKRGPSRSTHWLITTAACFYMSQQQVITATGNLWTTHDVTWLQRLLDKGITLHTEIGIQFSFMNNQERRKERKKTQREMQGMPVYCYSNSPIPDENNKTRYSLNWCKIRTPFVIIGKFTSINVYCNFGNEYKTFLLCLKSLQQSRLLPFGTQQKHKL